MSVYASIFGLYDDMGTAPLVYEGSHVFPPNNSNRAGWLGIAAIPGHISGRGCRAITDDMMPYHPWLRFSVNDGDALLTRKQVVQLRDALNEWLELCPARKIGRRPKKK